MAFSINFMNLSWLHGASRAGPVRRVGGFGHLRPVGRWRARQPDAIAWFSERLATEPAARDTSDTSASREPTPRWQSRFQTALKVHTQESDMAHSTLLGADIAPTHPSGRDAELLGPSDNSDSGSDAVGTAESRADSDSRGTGERGAVAGNDGREGGDILPDRVVNLAEAQVNREGDDAYTDLEDESDAAEDEE
jgi:hypothetical protein